MTDVIHGNRREWLAGMGALALTSMAPGTKATTTTGSVTRIDPRLDAIVDADSKVEVLAEGYRWAEGGVWVSDGNFLLFSDPPSNIVYRWDARNGAQPFLAPSGAQGAVPAGIREPGANGMRLDRNGHLVVADSGSRAIVRINLKTRERTILVDRFEGKRFNSPNDLVIAADGAIYFTDPPYGLKDADASPLRELDFNGVYRLAPDGHLSLIDRSRFRPNGIALSPDERTLYLALSDPKLPHLLAYPLDASGTPGEARLFHDMQAQADQGLPGLPDGVKTDRQGRIFATGPGGVHVCLPDGTLLGIIATGKAVANCCIGENGRSLFLASSDRLCRIRLKHTA